MDKEESRERYYSHKGRGLCVRCRTSQAANGHTYCEDCLKLIRKETRDRYHDRKSHGLCTKCGNPTNSELKYCDSCRDKDNKQQKENERKFKIEVLNHYGGCVCACCGETTLEFLQIDHINGGGVQHTKSIRGHLYQWLKKNNYPQGFQVLCANCNFGKRLTGVCPHKKA